MMGGSTKAKEAKEREPTIEMMAPKSPMKEIATDAATRRLRTRTRLAASEGKHSRACGSWRSLASPSLRALSAPPAPAAPAAPVAPPERPSESSTIWLAALNTRGKEHMRSTHIRTFVMVKPMLSLAISFRTMEETSGPKYTRPTAPKAPLMSAARPKAMHARSSKPPGSRAALAREAVMMGKSTKCVQKRKAMEPKALAVEPGAAKSRQHATPSAPGEAQGFLVFTA
mmetsp:Transcript_44990/g.128479  ORF Transcript_44990/g.128479 Transcript_44990/m.128479 type:complete len:228 (+) Transcript_44990:457-1140(+)